MSNNANMFVEFCGNKELVIGEVYSHTRRAKTYLEHCQIVVCNQNLYVAIRSGEKWMFVLEKGSDQHLATGDIRPKVASANTQLEKKRIIDSGKFRNKEITRHSVLSFKTDLQS